MIGFSNIQKDQSVKSVVHSSGVVFDVAAPYICFRGAEAIVSAWVTNPPMIVLNYPNYRMTPIVPEQLRYLYGVYIFELGMKYESHGFVLHMDDHKITVYNTYGGVEGFFIKTFNRDSWLHDFLSFPNLSVEAQKQNYHKPWGFTRKMVEAITERRFKRPIVYEELYHAKIL